MATDIISKDLNPHAWYRHAKQLSALVRTIRDLTEEHYIAPEDREEANRAAWLLDLAVRHAEELAHILDRSALRIEDLLKSSSTSRAA